MKNNTKSSITLPPKELELVLQLKKKLKAASNVEVVREGLHLLRDKVESAYLKASFQMASDATRKQMLKDLAELESLTGEGLD